MARLKVASVAVGIDQYPAGFFEAGERPLRFAGADARRVHEYIAGCWPDSPAGCHVLLINEAASLAGLEAAFARLRELGPFDMLWLYLSGHGRRRGAAGWFCTATAAPGVPDLDAGALDRLLESVTAAATILLVDCCHAETVVYPSRFFSRLDGQRSRVFLASSRGGQLSWEDESRRSSLFTYHFLAALAVPPRSGGTAAAAVRELENEVFSELREQVPTDVFRLKQGASQEPVRGGISSQPVLLPRRARAPELGGSTVLEAIRARLRQLLLTGAAAVLAAALVVEVSFYHLAVTAGGRLGVRYGVRELGFLAPGRLGLRLETPFQLADLASGEARSAVAAGNVRGIWWGSDSAGRRRWGSGLTAYLDEPVATRWRLQLGERIDPGSLTPPDPNEVDWRARALAEAALIEPAALAPASFWADVEGTVRAKLPGDYGCGPEARGGELGEFSVMLSGETTAEVEAALATATAAAGVGGIRDFKTVTDALQAVRFRARGQRTPADALREARGVANLMVSLGVARRLAHRAPLGADEVAAMDALSGRGCAPWPDFALAVLGYPADQEAVARRLTERVSGGGASPAASGGGGGGSGGGEASAEGVALAGLAELAGRGRLLEPLFRRVLANLGVPNAPGRKVRGSVTGEAAWLAWLREVTDRGGGLPGFAVALVFDEAERRVLAGSREELAPLQILAAAAGGLDAGERRRLVDLVRRAGAGAGWMTAEYAAVLGGLARGGLLLRQDIIPLLPDLASVEAAPGSGEEVPSGAVTLRAGEVVPARLDALGRAAQGVRLPAGELELLMAYAERNPGAAAIDEIYAGLAHQRSLDIDIEADVQRTAERLRSHRRSSEELGLEINVAAVQLRGVPVRRREALLGELVGAWKGEFEPEIKAALAEVVVRTRRGLRLEDL
jgi:hypothetical protein